MEDIIYPYQWELLAAMITYKVSNGLCMDYQRLGAKDFKKISTSIITINRESLGKWIKGIRRPAQNALDDLCKYTSDFFPYSSWEEFSEKEFNSELLSFSPNWKKYSLQLFQERNNVKGNENLKRIRNWVYERINLLATKGWFSKSQNKFPFIYSKLDEFAGEYKYFIPGQIPPSKYQEIYVNPLIIKSDGNAELQNGYTKKKFIGFATIKDVNTLQIILYPEKEGLNEGIEYLISIQINKYGDSAKYYPGVVLGFDGQGKICSYPILLSADLSLDINSSLVNLYLKYCYENLASTAHKGRLENASPEVLDILYVQSKNLDNNSLS